MRKEDRGGESGEGRGKREERRGCILMVNPYSTYVYKINGEKTRNGARHVGEGIQR